MSDPIKLRLKGAALLEEPRWNKGSAFTRQEREAFDLRGRLPFKCNTLDEQVERAYTQYKQRDSDILKNSFLQSMKAQNWILFYALLSRHTTEMYPIIYTPTEADAIQNFSHLFRRPEGLFLTPPFEEEMEHDFLSACDGRILDLIVVSDAEAILGIGDQGSGGIGISSAKAVIYTLAAGVDPSRTLAVTLDVGTDNEDLLNDELYIGYREKRLRGDKYDAFVDKFVALVRKHQPQCLLHFEDFGVSNAHRLLGRYRDKHSVLNDDIQGTGAVTLAALTAALSVTKGKLHEQRIVIYGAGSAGMGIARQLCDAIKISHNLSDKYAGKCFYLVDRIGLLKRSKRDAIRPEIEDVFVRDEDEWDTEEGKETSLKDVVERVKPTVLIGTSTHKGAFTEDIIREMAKHADRPIVFPLSNPISKCEADPKDVFEWTDGRALLATGSPFPPIDRQNGGDKYIVAECNNALIYPGLGLGTILSGAKTMTDKMIVAGAKRLGELAPAIKNADDALLPDFGDAADVNFEIALAVMTQAIEDGGASKEVPQDEEDRREWAQGKLWKPEYREYVYDPNGLA